MMFNWLLRRLIIVPLVSLASVCAAAPMIDPVGVQVPQGVTQEEISSAIETPWSGEAGLSKVSNLV
jgi:hypothetical protein